MAPEHAPVYSLCTWPSYMGCSPKLLKKFAQTLKCKILNYHSLVGIYQLRNVGALRVWEEKQCLAGAWESLSLRPSISLRGP